MDILRNVVKSQECLTGNMLSNNAMHVAFGVDRNYVSYAGVLITSILINNPNRQFAFHIFTDKASPEDMLKLKCTAEGFSQLIYIYYIDFEAYSRFQIPSTHISLAVYNRFIIPKYLSNIAEKVLFLDADMLCNNNITHLFEIEMKDSIAIVVSDTEATSIQQISSLGLKFNGYFNAGLMLINITAWEKAGITDRCIKISSEKNTCFEFRDQDILNILLDGKAIFVDNKFNQIYDIAGISKHSSKPFKEEIPDDVAIVHFTGSIKPWHQWAQRYLGAKRYMYYVSFSAWVNVLPVKPLTYKQMKFMAKYCMKSGEQLKGMYWYFNYAFLKIRNLFGLNKM